MTLLTILYVICGIGCFLWCTVFLRISYTLARVAYLSDIEICFPQTWPKLTIIVAACDEEDTIQDAMTSLLATDYPNLEFICVNDRSTDNTGQLMDELGHNKTNVNVIHINELPAGWIGKTHAMHTALQQATGEWILFTDADVHFAGDAVKKAMAHALAESADHLTFYPEIKGDAFWLRVTTRAFTWLYLTRFKVERLARASNSSFAGYGGFNLIRKSALEETQGLEWLKMDTVDDVGLGYMLNQAGAKDLFVMGYDAISVEWYPDLTSMFRGLAKNTFGSVAHYSVLRSLLMFLGNLFFLVTPVVSICWLSAPLWLNTSGWLCGIALLIATVIYNIRNPDGSVVLSLLTPVGFLIMSFISLYSMVVCVRDGGVNWRGTLYNLSELRNYQRLKL